MKKNDTPFWETKQLSELSHDEWEALCDGCGLCCLHKLQDEEDDNAPVLMTRVACHCYDLGASGCSDYANRHIKVPGCTALTVKRAAEFDWLPQTCAYRLRHHNLPLPSWHPLKSGTKESVRPHSLHALDPILETDDIDLEDYLIDIPSNTATQ
jgi:hypothetical protein